MDLSLSLSLGRLMRAVDPIVGQGELVTAPDPFYGYSQVNGTGIVIDQLNFDFDPDAQNAPFAFKVWPTISVSGSVRLSSGVIRPKLHCHTVYTLTYADDSAIAHGDELVYKYDNTVIDPYIGIFGNVGGFMLRDMGDYKLTVDCYVMTSTGQARKATSTYTFSLADHPDGKLFYDATNGNTSNDGKDPIGHIINGGLGLTNASYTHATGELTETGAFTSYTHSGTPTYKLNSPDWIYLDGFGLCYIESKTDANTIVIHENYRDKIGSDQTGLTSSDGPKAASDFAASQLNSTTFDNRLRMLSGQNSDVYNRTADISVTSVNGTVGVIGYGGKPEITYTGGGVGDFIFNMDQSYTNSNTPDQVILSNVKLTGNNDCGVMEANLDKGTTSPAIKIITDRIETSGNGDDSTLFIAMSNAHKPNYYYDFCSYFDNTRVNEESLTLASAITAGDGTFTVSVAPTNPRSYLWLKIEEGGNVDYRYVTFSGTTGTLNSKREIAPTFEFSYTTSATVTVWNRRANAMLMIALDGLCVIGTGFKADTDDPKYDHIWYPKYYGDNHILFGCYLDKDPTGDNRTAFLFNHNTDESGNSDNFNVSMNYVEPDACKYFSEGGAGGNSVTYGTLSNMYMYGNSGAPKEAFIYYFLVTSVFVKASKAWRTATIAQSAGIVEWDVRGSGADWFDYDWYVGMEENKGYNMPLHYPAPYDATVGYGVMDVDCYNNEAYSLSSDPTEFVLGTEFRSGYTQIYSENTIYMPNDVDGKITEVSGTDKTLAEFNVLAGYTNYGTDPGWTDPANGDFSTGTPVLNFDPSVPIYATIYDSSTTNAYITGAGSEILKIKFVAGPSDGVNVRPVFHGVYGAGYVSGDLHVVFNTNDTIGLVNCTGEIDGTPYANNDNISTLLDGSTEHEIVVTALPTTWRVGTVGGNSAASKWFDGQLYDFVVRNAADTADILNLPMDAVYLDGETETDAGSDYTLNYHGPTSGDWGTR